MLCGLILGKQKMKTYSKMIELPSFDERFKYLKIGGSIGAQTFGKNRYLNQILYNSSEWRSFRHQVIIRDNGCDLGDPDRPITGTKILIHHIEPLTVEDVVNRDSKIFDLENVVCVSFDTHQAIHYGDDKYLNRTKVVERKPNDTCPWR